MTVTSRGFGRSLLLHIQHRQERALDDCTRHPSVVPLNDGSASAADTAFDASPGAAVGAVVTEDLAE